MRRIVVIAAAAAALVGAFLGVRGLAANGDSDQPGRPPAFSAAERAAFAVLRGPTRPLPQTLAARLREAKNPAVHSLRFGRARHVAADTGMWVLSGPGATCIVQAHGGAVSCEERATLLRKGIALGVVELGPPPHRKAREFVLMGLVPNGVRAVRVKVGKRTRLLEVEQNAYSLRAPMPILVKGFET